MVLKKQEGFPKHKRLLKRRQFLEVQKNGHKVSSRYFIGLVLQHSNLDLGRLGITTTARYANAVVRNRTKRLVRETFRRNLLSVPNGFDLVVIPKKHAQLQRGASLIEDLVTLGAKLNSFIGEKP